jgi:RNA polymerase sigma factor (sigma-70 family)
MSVRPLGFQLTPEQAQMAAENLNLARREAWRFQRRTDMPYDDLESVAFIGLMKACHRFDPSMGWKFSTYSVPKIRGELLHFARDSSFLLRLSHRMRENWVKGRRLLDRGATDQSIADELKLPLAEWLDTRQACSGAPLELKDSLAVAGGQLEAKEDDRLGRLEQSVMHAWTHLGPAFAKSLAAHHRFDHILRDHSADMWVAMAEAVFYGRDICWIDCGIPASQFNWGGLQSVSVEQNDDGSLVIHAHDMGDGRIQQSLFDPEQG